VSDSGTRKKNKKYANTHQRIMIRWYGNQAFDR